MYDDYKPKNFFISELHINTYKVLFIFICVPEFIERYKNLLQCTFIPFPVPVTVTS